MYMSEESPAWEDLSSENKKLKEHIKALELVVSDLERGCACYRNAQLVIKEGEVKDV